MVRMARSAAPELRNRRFRLRMVFLYGAAAVMLWVAYAVHHQPVLFGIAGVWSYGCVILLRKVTKRRPDEP
jgi:hypothetical protein